MKDWTEKRKEIKCPNCPKTIGTDELVYLLKEKKWKCIYCLKYPQEWKRHKGYPHQVIE